MKRFILPLLLLTLFLPCLAQAQEYKTVGLKDLTSIVAQNKGKVVMLNFFATWCPPCREEIPDLVSLAPKYEGKVVIGKCDVEENDDITMKYGVRNIPTIIFLKGGQVVDKQVGACSKDALKAKIEKLL